MGTIRGGAPMNVRVGQGFDIHRFEVEPTPDRRLILGGQVFEGERAYSGKVFKLEEHTDRLFKSAEIMEMKIPFTPAQLNAATNETLRANNITDGYIRPIAWRGSEVLGVSGIGTTTSASSPRAFHSSPSRCPMSQRTWNTRPSSIFESGRAK